jgi:fatty acid synthase
VPVQVVTEPTPWDGGLVGVNAIGMTGIYGHLLLKSYDHYTSKKKHNEEIPRLVVVSGRTHEGLENLLRNVCNCDLLFKVYSVEDSMHTCVWSYSMCIPVLVGGG